MAVTPQVLDAEFAKTLSKTIATSLFELLAQQAPQAFHCSAGDLMGHVLGDDSVASLRRVIQPNPAGPAAINMYFTLPPATPSRFQ
jgi:hypothetical protein